MISYSCRSLHYKMKISIDVQFFHYCSQKLTTARTTAVRMEQAVLTELNHIHVSVLMVGMASSASKVFDFRF